ncbi:MAG: phosphatidylglycerophosphatase A [Planctomycetota bacterium]|nr:phosphatidylglycerophosphatase A [Planctomycetota bacterium]
MRIHRDLCLSFVATSFGLGLLPWAPGTWGALPGVGIYLAIVCWVPAGLQAWWIGGSLLGICAATILLTPWAERYWARKDPKCFVTDEVAGFLATVLLFRTPNLWLTIAWAFVVTRAFDIVKIPPARQLEHLPAGWGVLLDDLASSLYAAAFLHLLRYALPAWFA